MSQTKAFTEEFNGHPVIAIWEIDSTGKKIGRSPIISFGVRKGEAIHRHLDDILNFIRNN